jgi:broad specificity phosphatase PhoE
MMPAVTTVYLVRHGETAWNAEDRCQGSADISMNAAGRAQISLLASRLWPTRFDAAYTSPLSRARDTASILLAGSSTHINDEPDIAELHYGTWQGLISTDWPGNAAAIWRRDPWAIEFPGGESLGRLRERANRAVTRLIETHGGSAILLSAHGHTNRVILIDGLALEPLHFWHIPHPNASAYRIEYRRDGPRRWAATNPTLITCSGEESCLPWLARP